jgi:hypothetical protein
MTPTDPWETIRFATADQLITWVKLHGSVFILNGSTTPEGWPFHIVVAVSSPGNERAGELIRQLHRDLFAAGAPVAVATNPCMPSDPENET